MEFLSEYCAWSPAEWKELWSRRAPNLRISTDLLTSEQNVRSVVREACQFVGGAAFRYGFRLFHNGGTPLLERRRGGWIEEIVFRSPGTGRPGIWAPITAQIHLSCEDFSEVRKRYWSVATKPPRVVTAGNIGQVDSPERWLLWNLAAGSPMEPVVERIAERVVDNVIPWFNGFANPSRMRRELYADGVPLLDPITALEWCLFEFGAGEANKYLRTVVLQDEVLHDSVARLLDRVDSNFLEGGPNLPVARNVAALAATYGLDL